MIEEHTTYWMVCDECGDECGGCDLVNETLKEAEACGWQKVDGEDLCPDCAAKRLKPQVSPGAPGLKP
jgi:hypothetical protein